MQVVRVLDMSWNRISNTQAIAVAEAFKHNSTIRVLRLAHNTFGHGDGCQIFATAIEGEKGNSTLEFVDLSFNQIGEEAGLVLAFALQSNTTLETLILDGNPLGRLGIREMLRVMTASSDLREISFDEVRCVFVRVE